MRDLELIKELNLTFRPVSDLLRSTGASNLVRRAIGKGARIGCRWFGYENSRVIGPAVRVLTKEAIKCNADLFVAHSEAGLYAAAKLLAVGKAVAVDMEDWFSEDLPPESRKHRPSRLLKKLEKLLLAKCIYATCPSRAMSRALSQTYGCAEPTVVYNAFPWSDRLGLDGAYKDRVLREYPSIHWFSQTIGQDRGLSDLFAALPLLEHRVEIHLRGNPVRGFSSWMDSSIPSHLRERVQIHELVSNRELLSRISEHDIGFAGELPSIRSRDLTVTNKIMQYLLGGLAVIASNTAGQQEVAEMAVGAVFLYRSGDPSSLAARLNELLGSPELLKRAKVAALSAAEHRFCWERQQPVLLEAVGQALARSAQRGPLTFGPDLEDCH